MKKLLVVLFILFVTGGVYAQDAQTVSNEAKLEYNRGVDFYKIGQYDRSMNAFRRAIELDPNYIDAYYNLGSILEYLQQSDAALAVFKQIIVRKPDDYEALYRAAVISNKLGLTEQARSYVSLIPSSSPFYSKSQSLPSQNVSNLPEKTEEFSALQPKIVQNNSKFYQTNGVFNNIPSPTGITTDDEGNVYIASFSDNLIYKVTPDGKQIIFVKDSKINGPIAMVSDNIGNIYVSNYNGNNVIKISPSGSISVLIASIQKPYGMSISKGMLFVSSQGSNSVVRYKL